MPCPSCGFTNPERVKFCHECGVPLQNRCPRCAVENPLQAKFCGQCGAVLKEQPSPPALSDQSAEHGVPAASRAAVRLARLAEVYGRIGQAEEGFTLLAEALAQVEKTGERWARRSCIG
jgi:hypothetical protein